MKARGILFLTCLVLVTWSIKKNLLETTHVQILKLSSVT